MLRRIFGAVVLSIIVLIAQPLLIIALTPVQNWVSATPVVSLLSGAVALLPLLITVALLAVIWMTALRLWKRTLVGLPGFRPGLTKDEYASLDRDEKRIYRYVFVNHRRLVEDAGLTRTDARGQTWFPSVRVTGLTPLGLSVRVGGVALLPGSEIEKASESFAAAIPSPHPVQVVPSRDVRFADFVVVTRDAFATVEGLRFDDEQTDAGTLDDFLGDDS